MTAILTAVCVAVYLAGMPASALLMAWLDVPARDERVLCVFLWPVAIFVVTVFVAYEYVQDLVNWADRKVGRDD